MRVVGIDPSLTATGITIVTHDGIDVTTVKSSGKKDATLASRATRLDDLARRILDVAYDSGPIDLVVIEQPAYGQTTGSHHDRSGLWWLVVDALHEARIPIAEITPGGVKRFAAGKGNADKDTVLLNVARRWPDVPVVDNNQADSLILAAMGARHLGHPIDAMPVSHLAAMTAVRWPATKEA